MADLGALVTIAEKVFQLLQSPILKNMNNWESDLEKLNKSVSFIKNMLLDADTKPELSHGEQGWVEELNEVLYEADDLFDEVITVAKQKELNAAGAKFSKKVLHKGCFSLQDWPKEFCKLGNLRLLDIRDCWGLTCMPLGIHQLTNLRDLTVFKVGKANSIGKPFGGQLNDLNSLVNLRGELEIKFHENPSSDSENKREGSYLEHIKNLKAVRIDIPYIHGENIYEALIEKLQPNRNLMQLCLYGYNGTEIPRWGRAVDDWAINLPNLVNIELRGCERLHGIPLLSNLKHLKSLSLLKLNNLEYMEISYGSKDLPFFPSLEFLSFCELERLKGWWGGVVEGDRGSGMSPWRPKCFPCLSRLVIQLCPKLTSLPPCPSLESLEVMCSNKALRILPGEEGPANLDQKLWVKEIQCGLSHYTPCFPPYSGRDSL